MSLHHCPGFSVNLFPSLSQSLPFSEPVSHRVGTRDDVSEQLWEGKTRCPLDIPCWNGLWLLLHVSKVYWMRQLQVFPALGHLFDYTALKPVTSDRMSIDRCSSVHFVMQKNPCPAWITQRWTCMRLHSCFFFFICSFQIYLSKSQQISDQDADFTPMRSSSL